MPRFQHVRSWRDISNREIAGLVGDGEVRSFRNDHVSGHLGMNVAQQREGTRLIKDVEFRAAARIGSKIEFPAGRRRKDVMPHWIAVGKGDVGTGQNWKNVWREAEIHLIEDYRSRGRRKGLAGDFVDIHHGITAVGQSTHDNPAVDGGFLGTASGKSNGKYQHSQENEYDPDQQGKTSIGVIARPD